MQNPYAPPTADSLVPEDHRDLMTTVLLRFGQTMLTIGVVEVLLRGLEMSFRTSLAVGAVVFIASHLAVECANPRLDRKSAIGLAIATAIFLVHVSILCEARQANNLRTRAAVERMRAVQKALQAR